jgi:TonB family protein
MATVYRAQDRSLDRTVALKILPPEFLYDRTFARRFEQEARLVAKLEHPNIVPIYATGIDAGIPWMSMRLLTGGNLGALLERRRVDPGEAVRMLRSVANALDYAHGHGVVHRDVKPTNMLLDGSGHVCLGDFGLAQMLQGGGVTRTGMLVGTPHYMAPEQVLGKPAGPRSDVYSLGIVAYEMFVGVPPFTGESPMAVLLKQVHEAVPSDGSDGISPALMQAIQQAVAKDPADRWPSAGAFVTALELVAGAGHAGVAAPDDHQVRRSASPAPRWVAAAIGTLAIASTFFWWTTREPVPRDAPPTPPDLAQSRTPPASAPSAVMSVPGPDPDHRMDAATPPAAVQERSRRSAEPVESNPSPPLLDVASRASVEVAVLAPAAAASAVHQPTDPPPAEAVSLVPPEGEAPDIVAPPVPIRKATPEYPTAARAAQIEGDVLLEAVVGADGKVRDVSVIQAVHPLIDEAARKAVLQYVYTPGRRNGTAEPARVRITVSFNLR